MILSLILVTEHNLNVYKFLQTLGKLQKAELNTSQQNEAGTTNDSSYYADVVIKTFVRGSRQYL